MQADSYLQPDDGDAGICFSDGLKMEHDRARQLSGWGGPRQGLFGNSRNNVSKAVPMGASLSRGDENVDRSTGRAEMA